MTQEIKRPVYVDSVIKMVEEMPNHAKDPVINSVVYVEHLVNYIKQLEQEVLLKKNRKNQ